VCYVPPSPGVGLGNLHVRSSATAIRVMDARDWIPLGVVLALLLLYLAWAFTDPTEEGQAAHPTSPGLASVVR
jgi:hypothetical protein